jgi:hypothetical protein
MKWEDRLPSGNEFDIKLKGKYIFQDKFSIGRRKK